MSDVTLILPGPSDPISFKILLSIFSYLSPQLSSLLSTVSLSHSLDASLITRLPLSLRHSLHLSLSGISISSHSPVCSLSCLHLVPCYPIVTQSFLISPTPIPYFISSTPVTVISHQHHQPCPNKVKTNPTKNK